MRLFWLEVGKIWNIKILAAIAALCVLYFVIIMKDNIDSYQDSWFTTVGFAHYLTENYGTTLEQTDFEDFLNYRESIISELDEFIASNTFFAGVGIRKFQDYEEFIQDFGSRYDTLSESELSLWNDVHFEWGYIVRTSDGDIVSDKETPEIYSKWISFENVVAMYEFQWKENINLFLEHISETETRRVAAIRDSGEMLSILPQHTIFHTWRYAQNLSVLVILVTLILVSPLIASDRANRVNRLQYTSKQGRSTLKKQFIAVLLSAIGMTTILVAIFAMLYSTTQVQAFWNNGINSFIGYPYHWLSITFGEYCLLITGVIYLLSAGTAALAFVLSRFSKNIMLLLFKIIPIFVMIILLSNWLLNEFLGILVGGNILLQFFVFTFLLISAALTAMFVIKREKRIDIL